MRQYHLSMDHRMFDFKEFYLGIAEALPDGARIAEVGVADGASAIFLAETLLNAGRSFKLYLVDNLAYGGADQLYTLMSHVQAAQLSDHVVIYPFDSLNASCRFVDQSLDFVFLDSSHRYEQTKAEIRLWRRKVKDGGYLAGHDYNDDEGKEVKQAVEEVFKGKQMIYPTDKSLGVWYSKKVPV